MGNQNKSYGEAVVLLQEGEYTKKDIEQILLVFKRMEESNTDFMEKIWLESLHQKQ